MRLAQLAPLLIAGFSAAGCLTAPTTSPPKAPEPTPAAVRPAPLDAMLWDTGTEPLRAAFREFADSPGTVPNPRFATLSESPEGIRFAAVPRSWKVWRESSGGVREIALESTEILTYIGISSVDGPFQAEREVQCRKGKGDTDYVEIRRVRTSQGWFAVTLTAVAHRGTLAELLRHLRKHYGDFEGVCQAVQEYAPSP